jgi:hypothetical protein
MTLKKRLPPGGGRRFKNPRSGHYPTWQRFLNVTFWVECTPLAEGFEVHNAYCRGMVVVTAGISGEPPHPDPGICGQLHDALHTQACIAEGSEAEPSAGIMDNPSVKITEKGGGHLFDADKKVNGRKRHLLVDTLALFIAVVVHAANIDKSVKSQKLRWW